MKKLKKVALLGGAFDPITLGHLRLAKEVLANTENEELWLIPCPVHCFGKQMTGTEHRVKMIKIALQENELSGVHLNTFEIDRGLRGSTYELLHELTEAYPEHNFSWVIGLDNANTIRDWKHAEALIDEFRFIVVDRTGVSSDEDWWNEGEHIRLYTDEIGDVSSTAVREQIKAGDWDGLDIVSGVQEYIRDNNIYRDKNPL